MSSPLAYLDHDGSSPMRDAVVQAIAASLAAGPPNPTGMHAAARTARSTLEQGRRALASDLGVPAPGLIFTGSGVEALATAIDGVAHPSPGTEKRSIVTSAGERPETDEILDRLATRGHEIVRVPLEQSGSLNLDGWSSALEGRPALAVLHHANHETGVLQTVAKAIDACRSAGVPVLIDATWSFGRAPDLGNLANASMIALSFHRAGGPAGLGALWAQKCVQFKPLVPGAGERGRRGGVEPVAMVSGLTAFLSDRAAAAHEELERVRRYRDEFESCMFESIPNTERNGQEPRLPGTSNLSFLGLEAEALALRLDLEGICVAVGTACSSGSARPGHVLPAMGLERDRVHSAVRFSFGWSTTKAEVAAACERIPRIVGELRELHPGLASD